LGLGLVWASVCDLRRRRIPNAVTGLVFASGLLVRWWDGGVDGRLSTSLSGVAAAVLVIMALYRPWSVGGVGGGDVKLAAATGARVGLGKLVWFALGTAASGGVVALVCYLLARAPARAEVRTNLTLAVLHGDLPSIPAERSGHVSIPYAVAIAAGAVVAFFVA
jgi:Flp pilus assembly protein protease CpaA